MPKFDCAAILFDLDGVLVDSTKSVERQWRSWARQRGIDEEKVMAIAHGVRALEVIRTIAPHLDAEAEVSLLEKGEAADQDGVVVMPGAVNLVRRLPEKRWCVVTSGSRYLATARLQLAGIPRPKIMITADDVGHGKPHPEPYEKGAASLGFKSSDCLVIEDAPAGIRAAHAAGMKVIGLTSTYAKSALYEADAVIGSLQQLSLDVGNSGLCISVGEDFKSDSAISTLRIATRKDIPELAAVINAAFHVETFLDGTRTNEMEIADMMSKGKFLLGVHTSGQLLGSVYVEIAGTRGYFGMLAIGPTLQGMGLGRQMMQAAEEYCRKLMCTEMDLTVLSLRPELPPLYRKFGYAESGTSAFHPSRPLKSGAECHLIHMTKKL